VGTYRLRDGERGGALRYVWVRNAAGARSKSAAWRASGERREGQREGLVLMQAGVDAGEHGLHIPAASAPTHRRPSETYGPIAGATSDWGRANFVDSGRAHGAGPSGTLSAGWGSFYASPADPSTTRRTT
jgi:hypothetical protein